MIDFLPDQSQEQAQESFISFLSREAPITRLRKPQDTSAPRDAQLWKPMADLGWLGLGVAQDQGGLGLGIADEMLLFVQAGRHLISPALLSTVMGAHLVGALGQAQLASDIIEGRAPVGLASATRPGQLGARCNGVFHCYDAAQCDWLVAWDTTGIALLPKSAFMARERVACLDETVLLEVASLHDAVPAAWVPAVQAPLQHHATILNAAMLVGLAQGARDLAVSYAKIREQFGKPIGSFQAIKHMCADMAVRCEAASAQTIFGALARHESRPDLAFQAASAKSIAVDAAIENGAAAVRVHGGMGFTAECEAHLFLKRAHILDQTGDNRRRLQDVVLRQAAPV